LQRDELENGKSENIFVETQDENIKTESVPSVF
jgi:hypothetical protein